MDTLVTVTSLSVMSLVTSLIACVMSARTVSKQAFQQRKLLAELEDSNATLRADLDKILAERGTRQLRRMYASRLMNSPYRTADAPPHCHECGRPRDTGLELDEHHRRPASTEHHALLEHLGHVTATASRRRSEARDVEDDVEDE